MLMMSIQLMMMPVVIMFRGSSRANLKLHMQRHVRRQGERWRALAAAGGGRVRAGHVHRCTADAAGDRAG